MGEQSPTFFQNKQNTNKMNRYQIFYYEWGNEPSGYVSLAYYDSNDNIKNCGYAIKKSVINLVYHCPYN